MTWQTTGGASHTLSRLVFRPLRNGNAFEVTVERLADAIRLGVIPLGERLPPERELAEMLRVSRMTLREATRALAEAGFVEARRGRTGGTFVTYRIAAPARDRATVVAQSMGEGLHEALDFRRIVEPGAAELAATRFLSATDREYLTGCLAACAEAVDDEARRLADSRLHLALASTTGCQPLVAAVAEVQSKLGELLSAIPVLRRNIVHSERQHVEMVRAVLTGNPDGAREIMEQHCDATAEVLRRFIADPGRQSG
jgi:DNA-binding FadR family transcriptional regulator